MGQRMSLEDELINLRLTSKQMLRSSEKSRKNEAAMKLKLKKAIQDGNQEGARIYAQNAIREKAQSANFLRLSSRVDAVAARLETAIRMQQVTESMSSVVGGMSRAMSTMNLDKISRTMDEFEKQFEDMDVRSAYMEQAMDSTTAGATPQEQVDGLIAMVADEHGLALSEGFDDIAVPTKQAEPEDVAAAGQAEDSLEGRLAALRK